MGGTLIFTSCFHYPFFMSFFFFFYHKLFPVQVWAYEYLHLGTPSLSQQKADTFPRLSRWTSANRVSSTKPRSKLAELRQMIDNLTPEDVCNLTFTSLFQRFWIKS